MLSNTFFWRKCNFFPLTETTRICHFTTIDCLRGYSHVKIAIFSHFPHVLTQEQNVFLSLYLGKSRYCLPKKFYNIDIRGIMVYDVLCICSWTFKDPKWPDWAIFERSWQQIFLPTKVAQIFCVSVIIYNKSLFMKKPA